jgi:hypothetical protein
MIGWIANRFIDGFAKRYDYDPAYMRAMVRDAPEAFFKFARVADASQHRKAAPVDAIFAAKLIATVAEDCGPCTQLVVNMALKAGVAPATVEAALAEDMKTLPSDCRLVLRFTQAMIANEPADEMRADIRARWGERGLITIAYAIAGSRIFPQVKRVLGHAHACVRVEVAGRAVTFREAA